MRLLIPLLVLLIASCRLTSTRRAVRHHQQPEAAHQKTSTSGRVKRQAYPPNPAPFKPRAEDYNLPPFYQPNPGRDASNLSPIFPFHSQYSNGLDVNPGSRLTVDGNLNIPIMGWGIWDYKGGIKVGRPNTRVGFGSLNAPTNVLGISADTVAALAKDGTFQQARQGVPSVPVAVLPGNFVPVRCRPPLCNPFVHNMAFGVDVEPGDDVLFDGGIDFPIPLAPSGVGVRFPLNGAVNVGTDPFLITYGHGMGPVEPPGFKTEKKKNHAQMFEQNHRKEPRVFKVVSEEDVEVENKVSKRKSPFDFVLLH